MAVTAVIDARHIYGDWGLNRKVAGLTLVQRAVRMVDVNGAQDIVVWANELNVEGVRAAAMTAAASHTPTVVTHFSAVKAAVGVSPEILVLDARTVFHRGMIKDLMELPVVEPTTLKLRTGIADAVLVPRSMFRTFESVETLKATAEAVWDDRWQYTVNSESDAKIAERALWLDCRKPLDGMVSRHLNRYMSLFISRLLAPTGIMPNHISVFTFSLGILAGVLAALGGPVNFLLAGIVFQLNSVIDGCDGELARVRYQFSVLGEWLDTLSDDLSDVFFWLGLGWGASRSYGGPLGADARVWWWFGLLAVVGKLLSMVVYYRWLIANKRGDLLAFTWSFDAEHEDVSLLSRTLKLLKYFAKKDFIVFAAMLLGFLGWLPWILLPIAPGNLVVALSVVLQQRASAATGR